MQYGYQRLAIPLRTLDASQVGWWVIEPSSQSISLDHNECTEDGALPSNWKALPADDLKHANDAPIQVVQRAGHTCIRLLETQSYHWEILELESSRDLQVVSSLKRPRIWQDTRNQRGNFKIINHLGIADFSIESESLLPLELTFEFISRKFDFDSEYRTLTEDIATFCQQLLLSWDTPTRLRFNSNPEIAHELLLEQFLFLKNFMTNDRLSRLLEAISRNPHSHLVKESNWVPASAARSSNYLSDPMRMLRDWRTIDGRPQPSEVCDIRKRDTHDTAPNRFIKFALSEFRAICAKVCAHQWTEDQKVSTVGLEAKEMQEQIDSLLARRFFNEVGRMQRLPLDNQTLQKREGYREVLQAWLLTQAAASLNWEGEEDCYEGNTRDVATLYEYWIFIKLHELLKSMDGIQVAEAKSEIGLNEFISDKDGQLTINLKSGKQSCSHFTWKGPHASLCIDLHYERSFSYNDGATHSGSYSRRFRPDYTLSIYPSDKSEVEAEQAGKVAYLHFDAKYRAEAIRNIFGDSEIEDNDLTDEKIANKSERTYKRGDLLKMHTYNDALRHTIGSYVLYPGTNVKEAEQLSKFHEIAPGVGAMVMKPGNEQCLESIQNFLTDIFEHQSDQFSQYHYLSETTYRTHTDKPETVEEDGNAYSIARKDAPCVVLWLRKSDEALFRESGFAYCQAISEEHKRALDLNLSIEVGSEFIPCGGGRGAPKIGYGWRAKVRSARFISKDKLKAFIAERGLSDKLNPSSVEHYLLFEFIEATDFQKRDLTNVYKTHKSGSDYMAVTCSWNDILTV